MEWVLYGFLAWVGWNLGPVIILVVLVGVIFGIVYLGVLYDDRKRKYRKKDRP